MHCSRREHDCFAGEAQMDRSAADPSEQQFGQDGIRDTNQFRCNVALAILGLAIASHRNCH